MKTWLTIMVLFLVTGCATSLSFVLTPRGSNARYGDGESFYLGHRIDSGILLDRQPAIDSRPFLALRLA